MMGKLAVREPLCLGDHPVAPPQVLAVYRRLSEREVQVMRLLFEHVSWNEWYIPKGKIVKCRCKVIGYG